MLGLHLPDGHRGLYVEYWIKFQPEYRWHFVDPGDGHGINYAKIPRKLARDRGSNGSQFSSGRVG